MKTTKIDDNYFNQKLGKENIYLFDQLEEACVKITKKKNCYIKFKGEKEFRTTIQSEIVTDAYIQMMEISKEDYDNY